ncbi:right-handed parallel beta-helix repeat-containing protein [Planomonospora sp. ID67723]|uniref:right-handed parallel beta-helix repeat-containing protein n=1 Tax=Planomonospora sp. ID67723 TaxID=2738134 RepID=UPI0018C3FC82|nr:right-handed parallel beta-helix repeat-containing protein [Planomonospora sp. ID67723]MBG0827451.1 right-handed parallel beta-helix repeat-containing protein [Planomonospora sp. ID67723]
MRKSRRGDRRRAHAVLIGVSAATVLLTACEPGDIAANAPRGGEPAADGSSPTASRKPKPKRTRTASPSPRETRESSPGPGVTGPDEPEQTSSAPEATPFPGTGSPDPTGSTPEASSSRSATPSGGPETSASPTPTASKSPAPTPSRSSKSPTPTPSRSSSASPAPTASKSPTPTASKSSPPDPFPPDSPAPSPSSSPVDPFPDQTGGWPGESTTGVEGGAELKRSKSLTITKDGTVVENLEVRGGIDVRADDVTIRNVRLVGAGHWGIAQQEGRTGLTVEDSEISGNGTDRLQIGIVNHGLDITVRRVDIHTITDGVVTPQGLIEDSYIHDPLEFPGDHVDMVSALSGPLKGRLVVRNNTIVNNVGQTSAIALFQDFGVIRNAVIEGNFLAGGGYTLYAGAGGKGTSSNVQIINNVFSKQIWPKGGYYGPVAYWDKNGPGNVWEGNVWENHVSVPEP